MQLIKMGQCQCTDPFSWTDQPAKTPTPVPSGGRFQASPSAKITQPQGEEKDCEARPPLLPLSFGGRGAQSFPSPRSWMPWIRNDMSTLPWSRSRWGAHVGYACARHWLGATTSPGRNINTWHRYVSAAMQRHILAVFVGQWMVPQILFIDRMLAFSCFTETGLTVQTVQTI